MSTRANNDHPSTPANADTAFGGDHARIYAEGPPRQVPGFDGLHRMTTLLLSERVPRDGRVLVHGAGGGLELKALGNAQPGWTFDGVDPSADMLRTAEEIASAHRDRIRLHHGFIEAAPDGPFDGACSLLTFHFIPREARRTTLREIHRRLTPGAPFVVAHISFDQREPARTQWIARHVGFAGTDPAHAEAARHAIATRLSVLSPEDDETMLSEAGFRDVSLFYAGLSFRGWVGYA
jgi:tRNA (cmo5U34)-methyltransferase